MQEYEYIEVTPEKIYDINDMNDMNDITTEKFYRI